MNDKCGGDQVRPWAGVAGALLVGEVKQPIILQVSGGLGTPQRLQMKVPEVPDEMLQL